MLARENFDGPHVWHNRRTLPQDGRARQAGRARRAKRGGNPICPRRAFLACLALHGSTGSPSRAKSRDASRSIHAGGLFQHLARPGGPLGGPQLCSVTSAYTEIPSGSRLRKGGERRREEGGGESNATRISRTHRSQEKYCAPRRHGATIVLSHFERSMYPYASRYCTDTAQPCRS